MAVDTSISDMAWLTQPAQPGASFLRGAQAGSLVNENWRQNRELQMREMLAPLQRRAFQLQAENQALDIATKMRAEDDLTADKAAYMEWAPKAAQDPNLPIPAFRTSMYQQQAIGLRKSSGDLMLNKIKTDQNIGFINAAQKLMEDGFGNELIIDYDDQGFLTPESRDSIQQAAAARRSEELKKFDTRWGDRGADDKTKEQNRRFLFGKQLSRIQKQIDVIDKDLTLSNEEKARRKDPLLRQQTALEFAFDKGQDLVDALDSMEAPAPAPVVDEVEQVFDSWDKQISLFEATQTGKLDLKPDGTVKAVSLDWFSGMTPAEARKEVAKKRAAYRSGKPAASDTRTTPQDPRMGGLPRPPVVLKAEDIK